MSAAFYLLRYLPPKTTGIGEVIAAIGAAELSLAEWREREPRLFETPGFYSLAVATGETLTVPHDKDGGERG